MSFVDEVAGWFNNAGHDISHGFNDISNGFNNAVSSLGQGISNIGKTLYNGLKDILNLAERPLTMILLIVAGVAVILVLK